jgi:hypothetical protein
MIYLGFNHPYTSLDFTFLGIYPEMLFVHSVVMLYQLQGPHKLVPRAIAMTCIAEVPGSNFGKDT